eukprot:925884-Pelagomonas_calceolata.AAC.3
MSGQSSLHDHIVVQLEIALQSRCLIASLSLKTVVPWRKGEALLSYGNKDNRGVGLQPETLG